MTLIKDLARIVFIGVGATIVMDVWLMILKRIGVQTLDFRLLGRWVGHFLEGQFSHQSIRRSPPIPSELVWGWMAHYVVGIVFAGLLVMIQGASWIHSPSLLSAIALGMSTVVMPLFVMQPAMGSGFAASKTPTPIKNCLRSLLNHTVFGLGLYASAALIALASR